MKKTIPILILFLFSSTVFAEMVECNQFKLKDGLFYLSFSDSPYTGPYECIYVGLGSGPYVDGLKHGQWTEYYSGSLTEKQKGLYIQGQKEGKWIELDTAGFMTEEVSYSGGKIDGPYLAWHSNGRKKVSGVYINGIREGLWEAWHSNSLISTRGNYTHGLRDSEWSQWHRSGEKYSTTEYRLGNLHGQVLIWDEVGNLIEEVGGYDNGVLTGIVKKWGTSRVRGDHDSTIYLIEESKYKDDKKLSATLYKKGKLEVFQEFNAGVKHGLGMELTGCCRPIDETPLATAIATRWFDGRPVYKLMMTRVKKSNHKRYKATLKHNETFTEYGKADKFGYPISLDFSPYYVNESGNDGTIFEFTDLETTLYPDDLSWRSEYVELVFTSIMEEMVKRDSGGANILLQ